MTDFLDEMEGCVPSLRRLARGMLRDRDAADDLVQDCIERALRKRRLWRPTGPLRAWLVKIMFNIHRDNLRHSKTRAHLHLAVDPAWEPAVAPRQEDRLALNEIARAIDHLPHDQKQALLLVVLEGFSYAEAAKILEIPLGTLMSRLGRARKALTPLRQGAGATRLRSVK